MTKKQLMKLLRQLPDDMQVVIPAGSDGTFVTACAVQSEIVAFPVEDDSEEGFHFEQCFVIQPCTCANDDLIADPYPNLN